MSNNMFLKFTGGPVTIEGETLDCAHEKWVDIELFSWGAHHPAPSRTAPAAARRGRRFGVHFTKKVDSASHTLFQALSRRPHVETVNLEVMKTRRAERHTPGTRSSFRRA